jgi:integrase
MTKKLWKKVESKRQLACNPNRSKWITEFAKIQREDNRSRQRIKRVLYWYLEHYGEDKIPEARCAHSFRAKFINIEAAMNRWLKEQGQNTRDADEPTIIRRCVGHRQMD